MNGLNSGNANLYAGMQNSAVARTPTALERYRELVKDEGLIKALRTQLAQETEHKKTYTSQADACQERIYEINAAIAAMTGEEV